MKKLLTSVLGLFLLTYISYSQTFNVMHQFLGNFYASNPTSNLVSDGTYYYGTTSSSGQNSSSGTIYRINPDGTGFTTLHIFQGSADGAEPYASLILSGSVLYGTTFLGGSYDFGVIFKINTDGTGFKVLHEFAGSFSGNDGAYSYSPLVLSGSVLYGTTYGGGPTGDGTIFSINTDGSGYLTLYSFDFNSGSHPYDGLTLSGSVLYGTSGQGGTYGYGTIFKINTDGSGFQNLYYFNWNDGAYPTGPMILSGSVLYGTTSRGGTGDGTIFKMNTDGTGFLTLHVLSASEGSSPGRGPLVLSGSVLYGTATYGGANNLGSIFKLNASDGSGFQTIHSFDASWIDGVNTTATFILSGSDLIGTADYGGDIYRGTMYKISTLDNSFTVLYDYSYEVYDGGNPYSGFTQLNGYFYGITEAGGTNNYGTMYRIKPDGSGYQILYSFDQATGSNPIGTLLLTGGVFYGTTSSGGSNYGTVFSINPDGTGYTVLHTFVGTDGSQSATPLVLSADGQRLYGATASGGDFNYGVIFEMSLDGTYFNVLHRFNSNDGTGPVGNLVLSGSTLYGVTNYGGSNNDGTVFAMSTDGTVFNTLYSFSSTDGLYPFGSVILSGSTLYGSTTNGGTNNNGVIFKINTDGSNFSVMHEFNNSDPSDCGMPIPALTLDGTWLYGACGQGGPNNSNGAIFKLSTVQNSGGSYDFFKLYSFSALDGIQPTTPLLMISNVLYGTAFAGGLDNSGTLFALSTGTQPTVTTAAVSNITTSSAQSGGDVTSEGDAPVTARGVCYGTSPLPTTSNNTTNDGSGAGSYTSTMNSLSSATQYYVRAYATNIYGTAYGSQYNFWTLSLEPAAQSNTFSASYACNGTVSLTFQPAGQITNAQGYIILRTSGSTAPDATGVTDGIEPSSLSLPSGTTLATIISSTSANTYTDIPPTGSQFSYAIIPFDWDGTNVATYNYLTSGTIPTATVSMTDAVNPTISVTLSKTVLWPANGKMVDITAHVVAADNCPGVSFVLESITSSEADAGLDKKDQPNDIQNATYGTPDTTFSLRAERFNTTIGRIYTITYKATDASNNVAQSVSTVTVPYKKPRDITAGDEIITDMTAGSLILSAWPNPASGQVTIAYELPEQNLTRIEIYDNLGNVIASLLNEIKTGGDYNVIWDSRDSKGTPVPAGMYYLRITSGIYSDSYPITIMR